MRIFTKMKHALLVVAAMCCVGTAFAVDVTTSYAVVAEDVASDNKVSVEGITLTYGTEATWYTNSATVTVDSKTFTLYATGENGPSPKDGDIPTSGVYVVFEPEHDGTITAVVQNAGNAKSGYIVEDEAQNLVNGTVLIDGVETAWTSGTPFNSAATYNGEVTFNVKAGSKYYFYMADSKMRFMGFLYTYDDGYGIVWSQDFENEDTFSEGWTISGTPKWNEYNGSHYLHLYNIGASISFVNNTKFVESDDYIFEFDWNAGQGDANARISKLDIFSDNDAEKLFYVRVGSESAGWNSNAVIYNANGEVLANTTVDGYRKNSSFTFMFHFIIKANNSGVVLTVTRNGIVLIENEWISDFAHITGLEGIAHRKNACMGFDNLSLSVLGAKEEISTPSCSITGTYDVTRTVSIIPGVGTEGTLAEATYYTTNGDEPTKESEKYAEPFTVSESCTIKAISYLPDGTASEVYELAVEAGYAWPLNNNIVVVTGLAGEGAIKNPVVGNCYNNSGVLNNPEVTFSYTFNGKEIILPYTVTESGTLVATVSAEGYASQTEEIVFAAGGYAVTKYVDFTVITKENVTDVLGSSWVVTENAQRWSNWASDRSYDIASTTAGGNIGLGDFLRTDNGKNLIIGYGVGRQGSASYWVNNAEEGTIALYEVDESRGKNTNYAQHVVAYFDNTTLKYTVPDNYTLARASVYSPAYPLEINDAEGANFTAAGIYTSATYTRSIEASKYGTICLPFAPDAASLEAYNFYELTASTVSGTDGEVTFTKVDAPEANKPYIYRLADGAVVGTAITCGATEVSAEAGTTGIGLWEMVGSFTNQEVDCTDKAIYALNGETQNLMKVTQRLIVPPYRAYIQGVGGSESETPQMLTVRISGPTGIEQISAADVEGLLPATIYDLMGRPVQNPQKGHLYIQGGKKTIY